MAHMEIISADDICCQTSTVGFNIINVMSYIISKFE